MGVRVIFMVYNWGAREMIGIRKLISTAVLSGAITLGVTSFAMAQQAVAPGVGISDAVVQQIRAANKDKVALLAILRAQIAASPELAAQLAALVASANPEAAAEVATVAAEAAPEAAAEIATSVAQSVPEKAAEVAASVSAVVPEAAAEVAASVSAAVPESAAEVAASVSAAVPEAAAAIVAAVVEAVPEAAAEVVAASIDDGSQNDDGDGGGDLAEVAIDTPNENQASDASAN